MRRRDHEPPCPYLMPANPGSFLTGLIGAPIAHSASPAMHEQAAEALGAALPLSADRSRRRRPRPSLRMLLDGVRRLGFAGVNVTFPYKEAVVALLDELVAGRGRDRRGQYRRRPRRPADRPQHRHHRLCARGQRRWSRDLRHGAVARDRRRRRRQGDRLCAGRPRRRPDSASSIPSARKAEQLAALLRGHGGVAVADSVEDALQGAVGARQRHAGRHAAEPRHARSRTRCCTTDLWVADAVYSPLWTPLLIAAQGQGRARS